MIGAGGVGLNVVQGARMAGADKIVGVDTNPAKRELAEETGLVANRWDLILDGLQLSNSITDERAYTYVARGLSQQAAARDFSIYTISSMPLDETAESAAAAREIALSKGQVSAFQLMIDRIVPKSEHDHVPEPTSSVLLDIISGIEVEDDG